MVLLLGGTTEGKQVATLLENEQHPYLYSTKTRTKKVVGNKGRQIEGTLDEMKMINLCRTENIRLIIDAAHPFAVVLHELVFSVSSTLGIPLIRFERASVARIKAENIDYVPNYEAAMERLHQLGSPKLLALSGVQSIPKIADYWQQHETWFRVLDRPESMALAEKYQFPKERLIRAYPSDHLAGEMALYQQLQVASVLTKESGHSGKLSMKIEAATRLGIALLIICKPQLPAYDLVVHDEAELISILTMLMVGRWKTEDRRQKMEDRRWKTEDGSPDSCFPNSKFKIRMKEGFTTGTCATAAAKGALMALMTGEQPREIQVHLPVGRVIDIPVYRCSFEADRARCSVIKDAGDDPDATHGAEIGCEIQLTTGEEIIFRRGEGVGIVILAGLEIGVGEPAINPVPRKMIRDALTKLRHDYDLEAGIIVTVFVTDGKRIAKKTLNERVGIVEGISILGTTGIVKPYSSASYIASIVQGVDVAIANKVDELVLNSGARSEKYLRVLFPEFPEQAFIHYGNWIGDTLKKIAAVPIRKVSIGIMLGKAVKLAEGRTDTHSCVAGWNKARVQELARKSGYRPTEVARIAGLNMAGRLTEIFDFNTTEPLYQAILAHCYQTCKKTLIQAELDLYLIGKNGEIITYQPRRDAFGIVSSQ